MDDHRLTSDEEQLLEQVLLGEIALDAARVQAMLADSPRFRTALELLRPAATSLREFGEDAALALAEVDDADRRWAAKALRATAPPPTALRPIPPSAAERPQRPRALLAAAALLLVGAAATWTRWSDASPEAPTAAQQHLGGDLTWLSPAPGTRLQPGLRVAWDCGPPAPGGGFRVELCFTDGIVLDSVVTHEESLVLPDAWSDPPAGAERALRVHALDSSGASVHRSMLLWIGDE